MSDKDDAISAVIRLHTQLRTAQEVINKHIVDQLEGLHCVDCVAEPDQECDCPMLAPIFEAMRGYEEKPRCNQIREDNSPCGLPTPCPRHTVGVLNTGKNLLPEVWLGTCIKCGAKVEYPHNLCKYHG